MAIVIPLQRRRTEGAPVNPHSAEAYWRNSMVPVSIGMGVIIVAAVATLLRRGEDGMARPRLLEDGCWWGRWYRSSG